jgi:hypothetical protein
MKVREIMSDNVACCGSDTPLREVSGMGPSPTASASPSRALGGDMRPKKDDQGDRTHSEPAVPTPPESPSETDTSTDWDDWMKTHGGRPRPRSDVADRDGKFVA